MRKIDRAVENVPACLENVPNGRTYRELRGAEKEQIRSALLTIQGHRCAYCERRTGENPNDGHIEHFRSQAIHQGMTLDWDNMFWSCNDEHSCGKYKDGCNREAGPRSRFNPQHLIDPSVDNADDFLLFVTDGTVRPIGDLNDDLRMRACESLRVFNLADSAYLRKAREDAVRPYFSTISWLQENAPEKVADYLHCEQSKIDLQPFSTSIRHFFRDYS